MAFEAQDEFYIAKILAEKGTELAVGTPILISVEEQELISKFSNYSASTSQNTLSSTKASGSSSKEEVLSKSNPSRVPLIKFVGKRSSLSSSNTSTAAGPVHTHSESKPSPPPSSTTSTSSAASLNVTQQPPSNILNTLPSSTGNYKDVPNTNMRKVIAKRLTEVHKYFIDF